MEYLIGLFVAAVVCVFGIVARFDRERVFYPTMLIVVATYYILFATIGNSRWALTMESAAAMPFLIAAVAGFKKSLWLVAAALAGHGVFDFFHHLLIENPGMPVWWPGFCGAFDVFAGVFFAVLLVRRSPSSRGTVRFSSDARQPL